MKQLFLPFVFLFLVSGVCAQVPWKFSFQGVAKNANGQPLSAGTAIKVSFNIYKDSPGGGIVRWEEHSLTVNSGGIFNVLIGDGGTQVGTPLDQIDWGAANYFLQVGLASDGVTFADMGTTQLVTVPYAGYAAGADRALEAKKWNENGPVIQKGTLGEGANFPSIGAGPRLIWYPGKAAFRAGENYNGAWEQANIGNYSFAGNRGLASGLYSSAFGGAEASGNYTFSGGINAKASGDYSTAFGSYSMAEGEASTVFGSGTVAKAFGGVALGVYNNVQDVPGGTYQSSANSDRIFQIGNGTSLNSRSNAVTVLRNGNVGIGNDALAPSYPLDVSGRVRIRHNGATAGIYFDNSQSGSVGFVGMQADDKIGFFIGNNWIFTATSLGATVNGNLKVTGIITESDRRLKTDIVPVTNSLDHIYQLKGYNYYWKDKTKDQSLQTGLIAQEVEALFPELVKTDEKGMKSVNYVGLIPHLIEAIKELKKENQERLGELEAKVNSLLKTAAQPETTQSK
ncbi:tail fiber domain-containing protein [Dyadobacter bucti]|uniref:tail fiber domain-containing protein n=1 Tax=Dyadobacter bucti TaxID=2572203 RepID=UPI001109555E|nr:tail fiber domain-containing protein [Dyadobacter bucti]